MDRIDELLFEIIDTYKRHAHIAQNAKYQNTREMAERILEFDITAMWFLTQRRSGKWPGEKRRDENKSQ